MSSAKLLVFVHSLQIVFAAVLFESMDPEGTNIEKDTSLEERNIYVNSGAYYLSIKYGIVCFVPIQYVLFPFSSRLVHNPQCYACKNNIYNFSHNCKGLY